MSVQVHLMQFVSLIAGGADLHVYEISIRDNHQKWVSNQKEEPSSGSHCKGHSLLLCGKVSYLTTCLTFQLDTCTSILVVQAEANFKV